MTYKYEMKRYNIVACVGITAFIAAVAFVLTTCEPLGLKQTIMDLVPEGE